MKLDLGEFLHRVFTLPASANSLGDVAGRLKISDPTARAAVLAAVEGPIANFAPVLTQALIAHLPPEDQVRAATWIASNLVNPLLHGIESVVTDGKLP